MGKVVLCVDEESRRNPELIGLAGVNLGEIPWMVLCVEAEKARQVAADRADVCEAWVVSCDDMEPVNLAAALCRDRKVKDVFLVMFEGSGSAMSRAAAAGVTAVLSRGEFAARFALERERQRMARRGVDEDANAVDPESGSELSGENASADAVLSGAAAGAGSTKRVDLPCVAEKNFSADLPLSRSTCESSSPPKLYEQALEAMDYSDVDEGTPLAKSPLSPSNDLRGFDVSTFAAASASGIVSASSGEPSGLLAAPFIWTIVGGAGGVGKSSVAAVAALLAAKRGLRVALIDADFQFGCLGDLLGAVSQARADEVLESPSVLDRLRGESDGLVLVSPPQRMERSEQLGRSVPILLEAMAGRFDAVIVDTGAYWGEAHEVLLEASSAVLFLMAQRAASVRACRRALDLCYRCGIATGSFTLAINRCRRGALFCSMDVSGALDGAPVMELKDGGAEVEEMMGAGMIDELVASGNDFCLSVERMVETVMPDAAVRRVEMPSECEIPRFALFGRGRRERLKSVRRGRGASRRHSGNRNGDRCDEAQVLT